MEHFCKITELTFANNNQIHFEKTKDKSNHSAFVTQYTSNYNWLAVVDEQFINDNFNIYGVQESVPNFQLALKILKGEINIDNYNNNTKSNNNTNTNQSNIITSNQNSVNKDTNQNNVEENNNNNSLDELPENIEQNCIDAYNLIHSRFIQTPKGLQIMRRKYEAGIFGVCPRFLCNGQNLLPFGSSLMTSKAPARGYCPLCHDVYEADVLVEEQLENQRKKDESFKKEDDSKEKSDNQKSDNTNEKIQNNENTKSINSNKSSDSDSENKQNKSENDNQNKKNDNNENSKNNDNENTNLYENTEENNNNIQKVENQNIKKETKILDGACFGPYFPHFFLQMNRDLIPTTYNASEKSDTSNNNVFSTVSSKKSTDWKQVPVPAPFAKTEQMKYTIFGIPIDPNSDLNPHRVVRDASAFEKI